MGDIDFILFLFPEDRQEKGPRMRKTLIMILLRTKLKPLRKKVILKILKTLKKILIKKILIGSLRRLKPKSSKKSQKNQKDVLSRKGENIINQLVVLVVGVFMSMEKPMIVNTVILQVKSLNGLVI